MKILIEDCVGCGDCYDICPNEAIKQLPHQEDKSWKKYLIIKELCNNCGQCGPDAFDCIGEAIVEDDYKSEEDEE